MSEILDEELQEEKPIYRFRYGTCVFWLSMAIFGYMLRIMHWPGYSLFTFTGASGFIAYNIFFAVKFKGRNIANNVFVLVSFFWIVYVLIGCFFNDGHPFNINGVLVHSIAIAIFYILYSAFKKPIKK